MSIKTLKYALVIAAVLVIAFAVFALWPTQSDAGSREIGALGFITPVSVAVEEPYLTQTPGLGLVIPCDNASVYAMADGIVTEVVRKPDEEYGSYILIDHQNGFKSLYSNLEDLYQSVGDEVKSGQIIGRTRLYGSELLFEIHHDDEQQNPLDYISFA